MLLMLFHYTYLRGYTYVAICGLLLIEKQAPTVFRSSYDLLMMLRMVFQHVCTGRLNSKVGYFLFFSRPEAVYMALRGYT